MKLPTTTPRVLVLGASSEIGIAVCARYLAAGSHVLAHYWRNEVPLARMASQYPQLKPVQCDLSDLDAVAGLAASEPVLRVDALVCLAALAQPATIEAVDPEQLTNALNVGALANYLIIGKVGPGMAERGWGRIVIGSSIGVRFGGGRDSFAYSLSQHASEFIPSQVRTWAADNVLTNVIRIGVTDTKLHASFPGRSLEERAQLIPMRRPATVDEIADYLYWHGSAANSFVTGQVLAISGGE